MKKILFFITFIATGLSLMAAGITYNSDGSITHTSANGTTRTINMDGKTPYGVVIEDEKRLMRRRNFTLELIYSGRLSDDLYNGVVKTLFTELEKEFRRWLHKSRLPRKKVQVLISNCRFSKTGYCKRKSLRGITIYLFHKGKEVKAYKIKRNDMLDKKKRPFLASKVVHSLMN